MILLLQNSFFRRLFPGGHTGGFRSRERLRAGSALRIAGVLSLLSLLCMLSACLGRLIDRPTFTLKSITVQSIGFAGTDLLLGVEAHNPNNYDLEIESLDFKIHLNQRRLGEGALRQGLLIPKAQTSEIRVPVRVGYADIGDCLKSIITGREIRYKLEGQARVKAGLGSATVPFTKTGSINQKDQ